MTAEQQLERSVLEGKERDELSAIAQAMSLKTTSRTKKADIIDQILDATGVTSGSAAAGSSNGDAGHAEANGAKPARRSRSATATGAAAPRAAAPRPGGDTDASPMASVAEATAPVTDATAEAAGTGDSGPAVFVEPPELADGGDPAPRQNGQGNQGQNQQGNRNRQNQSNQNQATRTATSPTATWATAAAAAGAAASVAARAASSRAAARSSPTRASWSR